MIASLCVDCPELAVQMRKQLPDINIIDCGSIPPISGAFKRYPDNLMWVRNWSRVIEEIDAKYLWMLNDDLLGLKPFMYDSLINDLIQHDALMITPAFNSPHQVFHQRDFGIREVKWIDMTCPLIDLDKFRQLGGFDTSFIGYFADIDLSVRAREAGMRMYVSDDFEVQHLGGYTVKKLHCDQSNFRYNDILLKKYNMNWNELI